MEGVAPMKMHKRQRTLRDLIKEANDQEREQPISASCDGQRIRLTYQSDLPRPKVTLKKPRKEGFTLIELMICVVIIGILSTIAMPNYLAYIDYARYKATVHNTEMLNTAVQDYLIRQGAEETHFFVYPSDRWNDIDGLIVGGLDGCEVVGYSLNLDALNACYMSRIAFRGVKPEDLYTKQ